LELSWIYKKITLLTKTTSFERFFQIVGLIYFAVVKFLYANFYISTHFQFSNNILFLLID